MSRAKASLFHIKTKNLAVMNTGKPVMLCAFPPFDITHISTKNGEQILGESFCERPTNRVKFLLGSGEEQLHTYISAGSGTRVPHKAPPGSGLCLEHSKPFPI